MKKTCNVFPLFVELEQKKFLGPDKLNILKLKDLLKGLEEWSFFGNVRSLESKRKEYNGLLEIIGNLRTTTTAWSTTNRK